MEDGKRKLLSALEMAMILVDKNPCGAGDGVMQSMVDGIAALIGREYSKGLSQDKFAEFLGVSTRTLQRMAAKYPDFPKPRHDGHKNVVYDPMEAIEWREKCSRGERER